MELDKKTTRKIIGIITFAIVLFFVLQNIETAKSLVGSALNIISPFLFGAALAFILNLPMKMFERRLFKPKKQKNGELKHSKLKRPVSIILSFIMIILIISVVVKLVIPQLVSVIFMFIKEIPGLALDIKTWAIDITDQYPEISKVIQGININWEKIANDLLSFASNLAGSVVTSSIGFVVSLVGGIFDFFVTIVFAVYVLTSKQKLKSQIKKIVIAYFPKEKAKNILEICSLSKNTFANFITGQCIEAVILGLLCFVGMLILRLPFAATISVLITVMALLPIVGAFIGTIVGAILILSISPVKALGFVIFLLLLQQFEGNVIYPKVVGNSVGLPDMWVLFAVVVGGGFGGIFGLLIGLPTISVLYTLFSDDVNKRLKAKKIQEEKL